MYSISDSVFFPLGFAVRYLGPVSRLYLLVESINDNAV